MNTTQFSRLLSVLAKGAEYAGDNVGARQLRNVSTLFDAEPEQKINKSLVRKLRSSSAMRDSQMNNPRALQHIRNFREASCDVVRRSDLESLDAAIEGLDNPGEVTKSLNQTRPSLPPTVSQSPLATEYLRRLEEAGDDQEQGEEIIADLRSNKALDVAQLNWLVQQYAGASSTFSTRPLAIKKIGERLQTRVRRGEKSREIKRLTDTE